MKHILCVHPCPPEPMVGDERHVSDVEWAELSNQRDGKYNVWHLKRDLGTDATETPVVAVEEPAPAGEVAVVMEPASEEPPADIPVVEVTIQEPEMVPEVKAEVLATEPETKPATRRTRSAT